MLLLAGVMKIILPPELEACVEQKVLEGLESSVTPLTREDLESVRDIARKARGR